MTNRFRHVLMGTLLFGCTFTMAQTTSDEIQLSHEQLTVSAAPQTYTVRILKGKNLQLFCGSDWLECTKDKDGTLRIRVKSEHKHFLPRRGAVVLTSKKTNYSKVVLVEQHRPNARPAVMPAPQGENLAFVNEMDLSKGRTFWMPEIRKNRSVDNHAIFLKGSRYDNGIALHAPATLAFKLGGAERFRGDLAVDDEMAFATQGADMRYRVYLDGKEIATGAIKYSDNDPANFDLDVSGGHYLLFVLDENGDTSFDHAALGNGHFIYHGDKPEMITPEELEAALGK